MNLETEPEPELQKSQLLQTTWLYGKNLPLKLENCTIASRSIDGSSKRSDCLYATPGSKHDGIKTQELDVNRSVALKIDCDIHVMSVSDMPTRKLHDDRFTCLATGDEIKLKKRMAFDCAELDGIELPGQNEPTGHVTNGTGLLGKHIYGVSVNAEHDQRVLNVDFTRKILQGIATLYPSHAFCTMSSYNDYDHDSETRIEPAT